MAALSLSISEIKPLNRWDHSSIRPGIVGPVGEVNITPRLKSTFPGDFRWDQEYFGLRGNLYGSSVQNGQHHSYNSFGGPARTIDSNWGGRRDFKTKIGWRVQDLRAVDKTVEPRMGSLPQYSWRTKKAEVYRAKTTGNLFPIPRGGILELPTGIPRGGQMPRVTDMAGGDPYPNVEGQSSISSFRDQPNFHPNMSSYSQNNSPLQKPVNLSSNRNRQ